ncbi:hypothetical protein ACT3S2_14045 [Arthrobacter sp. AOP36-A1-22]|uniref:hypothetical protein n=1 Tax=Arthrobacter TaxID=1663 RepID=UPI003FD04707
MCRYDPRCDIEEHSSMEACPQMKTLGQATPSAVSTGSKAPRPAREDTARRIKQRAVWREIWTTQGISLLGFFAVLMSFSFVENNTRDGLTVAVCGVAIPLIVAGSLMARCNAWTETPERCQSWARGPMTRCRVSTHRAKVWVLADTLAVTSLLIAVVNFGLIFQVMPDLL